MSQVSALVVLRLVPVPKRAFSIMKAFPPPPSSISFVQRIENLAASGLAKLLPAAFALSALVLPASAATNLVKNGSFENNPGPGATEYNDANYSIKGQLPDWTMSNYGFMGLDSYTTATTNTYINNCGIPGSTSPCWNGGPRSITLWGATPGWQNGNGFQGSPDGGFFWIADGNAAYRGILSQDITGLTVGAKYDLSFQYAHGQEACNGCDGVTTQSWVVSFGDEPFRTNPVTVPSHGFIDWVTASRTFTATSVTQTLKFIADGGRGAPPMALLDGIILTAQDEPPTPGPAAAAPGPLPLLGLGASFAWSRRLRKRINQGGKA